MSNNYITHREIAEFADNRVNLKRDDAKKYREQTNTLREKLKDKLEEDSDFQLRRMLLSGSLAKHTSLKSLNDIDVALYVLQHNPPQDMPRFLDDLVHALATLYPNKDPSDIVKQEHSVRISYRGTGLDVDLVPIAYDGNNEWNGHLYSSRSGQWVMTNIDKHLCFINKRKQAHPTNYIQVIRLLKYWVNEMKKKDDNFRCKSFLIELIVAHLADNGKIQLDNYVEALADFFNFIVRDELDDVIAFDDYSQAPDSRCSDPIRVFDPVNGENNAASGYKQRHKKFIIDAAGIAADAVDSALYAPTKGEAIRYWRKIFGSSFGG